MPTARELLEEVDALMRRNRAGGEPGALSIPAHAPLDLPDTVILPQLDADMMHDTVEQALVPDVLDDIPLLTDVAQMDERTEPHDHEGPRVAVDEDVPLLTEIADIEAPAPEDEVLIGGLPAEAFAGIGGMISAAVIPAPSPQTRIAEDDPRWSTLAEDVRMQVLQRLDLFTERGLQAQLEAHLQPIVDRASAELVQTINTRLGEVLRAYVAEAIEREIEKWRRDTQ